MRPDLTSVRRAVGVVAVLFLLGSGIVYLLAPGFLSSTSSPTPTTNSAARPAPTQTGTQSMTPGEVSSSAAPSRTSAPSSPISTTTVSAGDGTGSGPAEQQATIQVQAPAASVKPFETVPIEGTYHGGADTFLRVQRWERGRWRAFPLPTKTDQSGQFTAYVELGQPGLYWLRVLDVGSRVKSKPFLLVVKG